MLALEGLHDNCMVTAGDTMALTLSGLHRHYRKEVAGSMALTLCSFLLLFLVTHIAYLLGTNLATLYTFTILSA